MRKAAHFLCASLGNLKEDTILKENCVLISISNAHTQTYAAPLFSTAAF